VSCAQLLFDGGNALGEIPKLESLANEEAHLVVTSLSPAFGLLELPLHEVEAVVRAVLRPLELLMHRTVEFLYLLLYRIDPGFEFAQLRSQKILEHIPDVFNHAQVRFLSGKRQFTTMLTAGRSLVKGEVIWAGPEF
jgi:hypothetical protein